MIPFLDLVKESGSFQAMITMLEPLMTQPQYSKYFTPVFNKTKDWKGIEKSIGRTPIASLVDRHSGKPIINTSAPVQTFGSLPSWGDLLPITSDELVELRQLEEYILNNVTDLSGGQISSAVVEQLTDQRTQLLVKKFQPLARMPLATMDKLAFEEWSNGTATIDKTKDASKMPFAIDFQVKKYHVSTVWSDATNATALKDLSQFVYKVWKDLHIRIDTLALNPDEIRKILLQKSTQDSITTYISTGSKRIKTSDAPSLDDVNIKLEGQYKIPALTEIDAVVDIRGTDGNIDVPSESYNAFLDGRVAATIGTNLGDYMYTLSPEQLLPDDDYTYAVSEGNVLISALSKKGELSLESDATSLPVLTCRKSMAILVTDDTTTGSALY